MQTPYDILLVGGGLAGSLLAYRLRMLQPGLRLALIEPGEIGGNHTWSFHKTDLRTKQLSWLRPFITATWDSYHVSFPGLHRKIALPYASITSEQLRKLIRSILADSIIEEKATILQPDSVRLHSGETLSAPLVLDCRGHLAGKNRLRNCELAWQHFVGIEVETSAPHELARPILMDACGSQPGCYQFLYCLPFNEKRILIEATQYSDMKEYALSDFMDTIKQYASKRGWRVKTLIRPEKGSLPIILSGKYAPPPMDEACPVGVAAGMFHPITGYSLPETMRMIDFITARRHYTTPRLTEVVARYAQARWHKHRVYRLLNRMLFHAGEPEQRWRILARFYTLPEPVVARFYAGNSSWYDYARIFTGKPPVPLRGALTAIRPNQKGMAA